MNKNKNLIRDEIKGNLTLNGWKLNEVVNEMNRKRKNSNLKLTTLSNISNKLARGTIKYLEVKEIAEIIGCNIKWDIKI